MTYTITTVTGDLPGAGTSANVYAQLHGTTADSKRFLLQSLAIGAGSLLALATRVVFSGN